MQNYNCFYCDGLGQNICEMYALNPIINICVWKGIANKDLIKYELQKGELTLNEMIQIFLETEMKKDEK